MLFSLYSQISLYRFWLKAWLCSASDQKYSFKITFLKMILSWLQNHLETLGGRAARSWHFSCVQTVVKLQLHSVLATLYLLSTLKSAHFLLPLFQTVKREKSTSQVSQRLPQCNLFLPSVCRWAPQKQLPLPCHGPWREPLLPGGFFCLKTRLLLTCASSSTDLFFSFLPPSVKWGDSQNLQKDSIIHSL